MRPAILIALSGLLIIAAIYSIAWMYFGTGPRVDARNAQTLFSSLERLESSLSAGDRRSFGLRFEEIGECLDETTPRPNESGMTARRRLLARLHQKNYYELMEEAHRSSIECMTLQLAKLQSRLTEFELTGDTALSDRVKHRITELEQKVVSRTQELKVSGWINKLF